ncbi:retrovirus-related Pol polyprotein from transposon TNT 1-94 [Trichonephila clavipes]|nr:retrovirus-related Pol polyprotein from transposon TNT 1-94 [Trichonephila clavipes]
MAKESVWFKNISPEVMDIYLADKNSKMMSQGTGNVSAKTVSTKQCTSINLTITDVSYVPQLRSKYENLTDKRIKGITDNGLEFVNEQLDTHLANSGIFHEKTIPYNSESNGKAERANRVLLERARSLLYESKLPLKFWAEAINCSTRVFNVTPRKGKEKIPLEIWTEETVYVLPPPGYEKLIGDDKVCKLKKSIYGLPQSGRNCFTPPFIKKHHFSKFSHSNISFTSHKFTNNFQSSITKPIHQSESAIDQYGLWQPPIPYTAMVPRPPVGVVW